MPFAEGMEVLPPESRVFLGPLLSIVWGTFSRTKLAKLSRTFHSQQQHFKNFINKIQLKDNYALLGFSQERKNLLTASYTVTLTLGYTLQCLFIKVDTMGKYFNAAEELSFPYEIIGPSLAFTGKWSHFIDAIIKESKRWEEIPNRKEPLTEDMILHIINKVNNEDNDNGIYHTMVDWLIKGTQTWYRNIEWYQDKTELNKKNIHDEWLPIQRNE